MAPLNKTLDPKKLMKQLRFLHLRQWVQLEIIQSFIFPQKCKVHCCKVWTPPTPKQTMGYKNKL